jgi:dihydrofolate reductase
MNAPLYNVIVAGYRDNHGEIGIGCKGTIPWKVPEDTKRFRNITMGHIVIMGRVTWESIPIKFRPLAGRKNIVISHSTNFPLPDGVILSPSLEEALLTASRIRTEKEEIFIIGGESIYNNAITSYPTSLRRLYFTLVLPTLDISKITFDTFFPFNHCIEMGLHVTDIEKFSDHWFYTYEKNDTI